MGWSLLDWLLYVLRHFQWTTSGRCWKRGEWAKPGQNPSLQEQLLFMCLFFSTLEQLASRTPRHNGWWINTCGTGPLSPRTSRHHLMVPFLLSHLFCCCEKSQLLAQPLRCHFLLNASRFLRHSPNLTDPVSKRGTRRFVFRCSDTLHRFRSPDPR